MITRQELLELSTRFSLRPDVVEKDYVLGWLLAGIGRHPELGDSWIFKGGTCLKKCYFETYRFSEDLDFTLLKPDHLHPDFLAETLTEIAGWVYEQTGLELPAASRIFEVFQSRDKPAAQGRIGYRGPFAPGGDLPRVKLDLTNDECVVLAPVRKGIHRPYTDTADASEVTTYAYEEIFAEKVRALSERLRPRDLYDVIHMYRQVELRPEPGTVRTVLEEKCRFKNIAFPTLDALNEEPRRTELEAEWKNMLAHQLPILPPFSQFWEELPEVFAWLSGAEVAAPLPSIVEEESEVAPLTTPVPTIGIATLPVRGRIDLSTPTVDENEVEEAPVAIPPPTPDMTVPPVRAPIEWTPPAVTVFQGPAAPLEVIRFAGANRLCVMLGYNGTKRLVEPYSIRRTKDNNLLLHTVRVDNQEARTYRVDKIQSAELSQRPFKPVYAIELTATGPLYAPPQGRPSGSPGVRRSAAPRRMRRASITGSMKYMFKCPMCGKTFTRKSYDAKLNEHKDKNGYKCYGTYGMYEGTKWG